VATDNMIGFEGEAVAARICKIDIVQESIFRWGIGPRIIFKNPVVVAGVRREGLDLKLDDQITILLEVDRVGDADQSILIYRAEKTVWSGWLTNNKNRKDHTFETVKRSVEEVSKEQK
jgi:uncharacterized protein YqfA (UPF0365 family)